MTIIKKIAQKVGIFFLWLFYGLLSLECFLGPLVNSWHGILNVFGNVGLLNFGICLLSILLGSVVVAPRFDKKYKEKIILDKDIDTELFSLLMSSRLLAKMTTFRFMIYANCIVFPKYSSNRPGFKKWFKGDSLRAQARSVDKVFAFTLVYTAIIALSFVPISSAISYFK